MPSPVAALGDFDVFVLWQPHIDNDGIITNGLNPDGGVDINDQLAFFALYEIGDPRGDIADGSGMAVPDAMTDINDLIYFQQMYEQGYSVTPEPVRFGWRGYLWDGKLNVHHVRHRVFDPKLMTWLQPDPLGTIDGPNIYAYAGWDPFNKIDPLGLALWNPLTWLDDNSGPELIRHHVIRDGYGPGGQRGFWKHHYDRDGNYIDGASTFRPSTGASDTDDYLEKVLLAQADIVTVAGNVKHAVETGVQVAGIAVMIVVPGPDDAVFAVLASRYGIRALIREGKEIFGISAKTGEKVVLGSEHAKKAEEAFERQRAIDRVIPKPRNLTDQLALQEARAGAGKVIMTADRIDDLAFKGGDWVKMGYKRRNPDGTLIEVHYMKNTRFCLTDHPGRGVGGIGG